MRLSDTRRAWRRWQAGAGVWRAWAVCPALLAPDVEDVAPATAAATVAESAASLAAELATTLACAPPTAVVLDLVPTLGVHLAARLNAAGVGHAVLVMPRWPYAQAVLPVAALVHALTALAPRLTEAPCPHVVFVLDARRSIDLENRPPDDPRADNRYRLAASDLPNLAMLRARGVRRVLKISHA